MKLHEAAERGPHPVGQRSFEVNGPEGRVLAVDVWFPADSSHRDEDFDPAHQAAHQFGQTHEARADAQPDEGAFPLVLFSHGNSGMRHQSTFLTTHLASWGFVVAAPDHKGNTFFEMLDLDEDARIEAHRAARRNRPGDLLAVADALRKGDAPRVDTARTAVVGHSFGGWTACKLPGRDASIRAVCGLAPASEPFVGRRAFDEGELPFPAGVASLLIAGADDVLVDLDVSVKPLFARLDGPSQLVAVDGADHFHFCDGIGVLHQSHFNNKRPKQTRPAKPGDALLPEPRMHRLTRGLVTAFLTRALDAAPEPFDAGALAGLDASLRVV